MDLITQFTFGLVPGMEMQLSGDALSKKVAGC